jgi:hypothetical protein
MKKEDLRFTLTVVNGTDDPLTQLHIVNIPPDYTLDEICSPVCRKLVDSAAVSDKIDAGTRFSAWGRLTPVRPRSRQKLMLVIQWTQRGEPNASVVTLGDNEIQGLWYYRLNHYLYGPIKTFAIPAALALIGYLLNKRAKKREEAKADADREQGIRAEIWKQMLPISHKFASKFYLPIATAAAGTNDALVAYCSRMYGKEVSTESGDEAARVAFFYSLLLDNRMRNTSRRIGGFIFKDLRGEELAGGCWAKYRSLFVGEKTSSFALSFREAAALIDFKESYGEFLSKFWTPPEEIAVEMQCSWRLFQAWLQDKAKVLNSILYLQAFTAIVDYETNHPYEYWYKPGPTMRAETKNTPDKKIAAFLVANNIKDTVPDLLRALAQERQIVDFEQYFETAIHPVKPETSQGGSQSGMRVILMKIPLLKQLLLSKTGSTSSPHLT